MLMIINFSTMKYIIVIPYTSHEQHQPFVTLVPYLLKERVAVGMLMGDRRCAGLRSLSGLDFVNPPLYVTLFNYISL